MPATPSQPEDVWIKCPGCEAPVPLDQHLYCDHCRRCLLCGCRRDSRESRCDSGCETDRPALAALIERRAIAPDRVERELAVHEALSGSHFAQYTDFMASFGTAIVVAFILRLGPLALPQRIALAAAAMLIQLGLTCAIRSAVRRRMLRTFNDANASNQAFASSNPQP